MNENKRMKIYAIYDSCAEVYQTPIFFMNQRMAERAFTQAVNQTDHPFNNSPGDFSMWFLGEWDDDTAELMPIVPKQVLTGISVHVPPTEEQVEINYDQEQANG